ncbi:MAG: hypothetical protein WKF83_03665 [Nocardioidaceae bacterium]
MAIDDVPMSPEQVAQVQGLLDAGRINDKLARQVFDGVLAGEGTPEEVVARRGARGGLGRQCALGAAVDRAIEANPDVAAKIARRASTPRRVRSSVR